MTDDMPPGGEPRSRGSMRHQEPGSTTPRQPTVAEQRARRKALAEERDREIAQQEAERKAETRRKVLIGSGVTVGLVGLVAGWYLVVAPEEVTAVCTNAEGIVAQNPEHCDEEYVRSHGGYIGPGGFLFLPLPGGGMGQYRYNYGGTGAPGTRVSGGTFTRPSNATITTKTGKTIQRGGFGISGSGKSGGS
ncbi:hypothetical protein SAMN05421810_107246 [Amycolatopsis arida]|uniref:Uncharacterized protein n=1 Tax=Amycolatopsis arida TaxID=587909 RepID=A0A1I5YLF4_9PSEU|nr:hypothetical protein [Amycolatopsis arida]TDX90599.1 hypothetical protein CLV69_107246 [Amycolatopsis arida]SFQ44992.1 hypothetical protein SAMN05421810_107246 [Amycolatopsis arida]